MLLMSNIFDIIFVYFCAKAIEDQTEASKKMISKNEYVKRRRYILTNDSTFHFSFGYFVMRIWIFRRKGSRGEDPEEKTERRALLTSAGEVILIGPVIHNGGNDSYIRQSQL